MSKKGEEVIAQQLSWKATIIGEPVMSRDVGEAVLVRGFPTIVRTGRARLWVARAVRQLAGHRPARPFTAELAVECRVWSAQAGGTQATELLAEALERAGIVADGRQIRETHFYSASDRARPRVEIALRLLSPSDARANGAPARHIPHAVAAKAPDRQPRNLSGSDMERRRPSSEANGCIRDEAWTRQGARISPSREQLRLS